MSDDDLHWFTAADLRRAYESKALSPVEVTEYLLGRIDARDAALNAFCHMDAERTLDMARESEERWMIGVPLSPLDGVPVAIKDLLFTKDWPTLRGSLTVDKAGPWDMDAPSVARLREAGAVLLGKTTTPEFGWKATTDSPLTGITRNPWNKELTPGGSSGGSAAAVAAGFAPLALGTDGGGSVRLPASLTGTFGLKPSFGRVPAYPLSPFGTVAHVGPHARTVQDAAILLNEISKPDTRDWHSLRYSRDVDYTRVLHDGVRGLRIAFSPRLGYAPKVLPEVDEAVRNAATALAQLGAHVEEVDPGFADPVGVFRVHWWAGARAFLGKLPPDKTALLEPDLRKLVEQAAAITFEDYMAAIQARGTLGSQFRQFMENYDALLCPSVATTAFPVGRIYPYDDDGNAWLSWTPFTLPFNLTQNPAASINCGFSKEGLPIGLQIVGKMFDDAMVLRVAAAYEQEHSHAKKRPADFA
ncbi:MAG: amidase [Alphaproteobacteria bacterium]|nr:amidase [Alphaproteobacteria bacterium]